MSDDLPTADGERQPAFKAPWPALVLAASILGGYALQTLFPPDLVIGAWGFSPMMLESRPATVITAVALHGSWAHALMNAVFALTFGAPVARFLGLGARGVAALVLFYVVCGALGNLAFAAIHPHEPAMVVGASGAISGLMGAAARLIAGRGWPGPILSAPVLGFGGAVVIINLLVALTGMAPGLGDATIAWEAHIGGFAAGVLLFGPAARLARG